MYTKFPYGTSAENDQLLLPDGMISIDIEKKAIRLHDGVTQGGFEALGKQVLNYGILPATSFITGDALANEMGLTSGVPVNSDTGWLYFIDIDNITKYAPVKPIRTTVSWNDLSNADLVFGSRTVTINGRDYKVRLFKGASSDPAINGHGFDHSGTHGSEWNRLFYHVAAGESGDVFTSIPGTPGDWMQLSNVELGSGGNIPGRYCWCQETVGTTTSKVLRGGAGITHLYSSAATFADAGVGWRPVLELIE